MYVFRRRCLSLLSYSLYNTVIIFSSELESELFAVIPSKTVQLSGSVIGKLVDPPRSNLVTESFTPSATAVYIFLMACRHAGLWRLLTVYSLKQLNGEQPIWRKLSTTAPVVGIYRINTISRKMSTEQGKAGGLADDVIEKLCHEPDESTKVV